MRTSAAATLLITFLLPHAAQAQTQAQPQPQTLAQVTVVPNTAAKPQAVVKKPAPPAQPNATAATPGAPPLATPKPAAIAGAAKKSIARECTRLPLSDIQFGREYTIKVAREKLEDYAKKVAKDKGWNNGYTRSAEAASCEDYLWLPVGGQEYKCLVTATFCRK
jgi:hypothetical protein